MNTVNSALDTSVYEIYVRAQVAAVDPDFWAEYGPIVTGLQPFDNAVDEMKFDTDVWFPKLEELRDKGLICSMEQTRNGVARVIKESRENGIPVLRHAADRASKDLPD